MVITADFLIKLPCTARELESALHKACDHDGKWDAKIHFAIGNSLAIEIEPENKGESK